MRMWKADFRALQEKPIMSLILWIPHLKTTECMSMLCRSGTPSFQNLLRKMIPKSKMRQITIRKFCNHRVSEAQKNKEPFNRTANSSLKILPFKYYYCFQVMIFQTLRKSSKRSWTLWNQKIKIQTWIATRRLKNSERKSGVFTIKDNLCRMPTHSQWEMKTSWCHRWGREKQIVGMVLL